MITVDLLYFFLELAVLEDNKELKETLAEFQMPTMQYGTLKIAGFGKTHKNAVKMTTHLLSFYLSPDLWYQMMLPPNFKKSKKYPLLVDV